VDLTVVLFFAPLHKRSLRNAPFGAILYEMLLGSRAFHRASTVETMNAILNDDLPNISGTASSIPPGLQKIVRRTFFLPRGCLDQA
jgi:hypothetical protein